MTATGSPGARPLAADGARAMVQVAVPPAVAFVKFTQEIDQWWRRGPRFRNAPGEGGLICIEAGIGGRVFESFSDRGADCVVELGRVLAWEPPRHLSFAWRNSNFAPGEQTLVEIDFEPSGSGTRVTVQHSGWNQLRADHPARHGLATAAFLEHTGRWWGDQLTALRVRCAR